MAAKTTSNAPDTSAWDKHGRNVRTVVLDGVLFIAVAIDEKTISASPVSGSGKSKSVGTTLGNVGIPGTGIKLGVNAYQPV